MRSLTITLDLQMPAWEIPKLRAAVAERVGKEYELFHMHNNNPDDNWEYRTHYPLIQYSMYHGRVQITGLNAGAEALQCILLPKLSADWTINGQQVIIPAYQVRHGKVELTLGEQSRPFRLYQWQALNQENYKKWDACRDDETAQLDLLSRALTGHLRSFAEGMGLSYYKAIEAKVTGTLNRKKVKWHGTSLMTFDVQAESNFKVPYGIGLGRLVAYGFGRTGKIGAAEAQQLSSATQVSTKR